MYILGLNCYLHDSSACLLRDNEIVAAAEEERFSRKKHTGDFPYNAIKFCLEEGKINFADIDYVTFYWRPWKGFLNRAWSLVKYFPKSLSAFQRDIDTVSSEESNVKKFFDILKLRRTIIESFALKADEIRWKLCYVEHHLAHAASTFFVSPFKSSAILTVDANGEWTTTLFGEGKDNKVKVLKEISYPHSLGVLYSTFTDFLGFKTNSDEYKVMGLAPYGQPRYMDKFKKIIQLKPQGEFVLDMNYFKHGYDTRSSFYTDKMIELFGQPRKPAEKITQHHADIASSLQETLEEALLHLVDYLYSICATENLCIAGGVGLNSVANGRILRESKFKQIFIQPAAHDAGGALGSALYLYHHLLNNNDRRPLQNAYLGPSFESEQILGEIKRQGIPYEYYEDITPVAARLLSEGKIVGWFQSRMEYGPRALGNRSILADPRRKEMKDILNAKVKHREGFRPFAPSVLEEDCEEFFSCASVSPYMLLVYDVKPEKRHLIPAVTHVDGTARVQSVNKQVNPLYWKLIDEFKRLTSCSVILNTSFNVMGEPIVCTPGEAINCFRTTGIDCLVMGNYLIRQK